MGVLALPASAATLAVGASVVPYAKLESSATPGSLVVSDADARRGWVRVPTPLSVTVRTNSRDGYRVAFRFIGDFVTGASVSDGPDRQELTPADPTLFRPSDGPTRETLQLELRLVLAPDARPGVYYWPLEVVSVEAAGAR